MRRGEDHTLTSTADALAEPARGKGTRIMAPGNSARVRQVIDPPIWLRPAHTRQRRPCLRTYGSLPFSSPLSVGSKKKVIALPCVQCGIRPRISNHARARYCTECSAERGRAASARRYAAKRDEILPRQKAYQKQRYRLNRDAILSKAHERGEPCRGCGTPRVFSKSRTEPPLCHECRRAERARLDAVEARLRAARLALVPERPVRTWRRGSGRGGTGAARYRRLRLEILAESDVCGICGHPGAMTVDHVIPAKHWPKDRPGFNEKVNMQPAHGSLGSTGAVNRCATCGRLCNQSKSGRLR